MAKLNQMKQLIQKLLPFKQASKTPSCNHVWKSYPAYLDTNESHFYSLYDCETTYSYELIAPYVCEKCGCVHNTTLSRGATNFYYDYVSEINKISEQYGDYMKPKVFVMKMISDAQMKGE